MTPLDWWKVKPSTSPPLSWAEVLALPVGMVMVGKTGAPVVLLSWDANRLLGWRRAVCPANGGGWSKSFIFDEDFCRGDRSLYLPRLPRLSFALTTDAVRERRKTVTRRLSLPSWWKQGAWFLGVDKIRQAGAQGLCIGRCGPATHEPLEMISQEEVDREGFPHTTPKGFCAMFRSRAPRDWDGWVWRLPFSYLEIPT